MANSRRENYGEARVFTSDGFPTKVPVTTSTGAPGRVILRLFRTSLSTNRNLQRDSPLDDITIIVPRLYAETQSGRPFRTYDDLGPDT